MIADLHDLISDAKKYYSHESPDKAGAIERDWCVVLKFLNGIVQGIERARSSVVLFEFTLIDIPENVFQALLSLVSNVPKMKKLIFEDPRIERPLDAHGFNVFFLAYQNSLRIHKRPGTIHPKEVQFHADRIHRLNGVSVNLPEIEKSEPFPVQVDQVTFGDMKHGAVALHDALQSLKSLNLQDDVFEKSMYDIVDRFLIAFLSTEEEPSKNIAALYTLEDVPEEVCSAIALLQGKSEEFHLAVLGYDPMIDGEVSYDKRGRRQSHLQNPLATNPINIAVLNTQRRLQDACGTIDEQFRFDLLTAIKDRRVSVGIVAAHSRVRLEKLLTGASTEASSSNAPWAGFFATGLKTLATWWSGVLERQREKSMSKMIQRWIEKIRRAPDAPGGSLFSEMATTMEVIFHEGKKRPEIFRPDLLRRMWLDLGKFRNKIDPAYLASVSVEEFQSLVVSEQVEMLEKYFLHLVSARKDLAVFPEFPRSVRLGVDYEQVFTTKKLPSRITLMQCLPSGRLVIFSRGVYIVDPTADYEADPIGLDVSDARQMRLCDSQTLPLFLSEKRIYELFDIGQATIADIPLSFQWEKRVLWDLQKSIVHKFYVLFDCILAVVVEDASSGFVSVQFRKANGNQVTCYPFFAHIPPEDVQILPGNYLTIRRGGSVRILRINMKAADSYGGVELLSVGNVAVSDVEPLTLDNGITLPPKKYPNLPAEFCGPICFVPKKEIITSTARGEIVIFDLEMGKIVSRFSVHSGPVTHIQVLPDGSIVSAGADGHVVISKPTRYRYYV